MEKSLVLLVFVLFITGIIFIIIGLLQIHKKIKIQKKLIEAQVELIIHLKEYNNKFFGKPEPITYVEYCKKKGLTNDHNYFQDYWKEYCKNLYFSYHIREISKNANVLFALISSISSYNFVCIEQYMESVNWTWHDNKVSPTKDDMIDNIISLSYYIMKDTNLKLKNKDNNCNSGGFNVNIQDISENEEENIIVTITFNKNQHVI
jgi:hypothetical protein